KAKEIRGLNSLRPTWLSFQRPVSVDELQYRVEHTPTLANHLALAQRLIEKGRHAEALPHLERAHTLEPEHCQVLYSLAVCYSENGGVEKAIPLLEKIVERDRCWSGYSAW